MKNSEPPSTTSIRMQWWIILLIIIGSLIGIYLSFLILMAFAVPQQQYPPFLWTNSSVLYMHWMKAPWWKDLWKPSTLGFTSERVHPFILETYVSCVQANRRPDHERIFAWHILPLDKETSGTENGYLQILQNDKAAKVIIYCTSPFL
jgi:hypothetical protein